MPLFQLRDLAPHLLDQLTALSYAGVSLADQMATQAENLTFDDWAKAVRSSTRFAPDIATNERLAWIWETLRTDADLSVRFAHLVPAHLRGPTGQLACLVLPAGQTFLIGLHGLTADGLLSSARRSSQSDEVTVFTLETLSMRRGKGHRFECCDCRCQVTIRVPEVYSLEKEAALIGLPPEQITLCNDSATATVNSLNQAYTVASRRLEPNRRSHGGRIYDHLVYIGEARRIKLEEIRQLVEAGQWPIPATRTSASPRQQG